MSNRPLGFESATRCCACQNACRWTRSSTRKSNNPFFSQPFDTPVVCCNNNFITQTFLGGLIRLYLPFNLIRRFSSLLAALTTSQQVKNPQYPWGEVEHKNYSLMRCKGTQRENVIASDWSKSTGEKCPSLPPIKSTVSFSSFTHHHSVCRQANRRIVMPRPGKSSYSTEKPPYSYIALTAMAIQQSPDKMLPLNDIYKVISPLLAVINTSVVLVSSSLSSIDFRTIERTLKSGRTLCGTICHSTIASLRSLAVWIDRARATSGRCIARE